jgi:hypothetical protein
MTAISNGLTIADLTTLVGLAVVVAIIVELVKRTAALSDETTKRFGPALACATGTVLGVATSFYLTTEIAQGALTGFLAGALASGLYNLAAEQIGKLVSSATGGRVD